MTRKTGRLSELIPGATNDHGAPRAKPVIPAKAGIQRLLDSGRVSLARNDNPTPENVKLCKSPGRAGGLPNGQLKNIKAQIQE